MRSVLILTHEDDLTADFVIMRLRERDCEIIRWNPASFPLVGALTGELSADSWDGEIVTESGRHIPLAGLTSIWVRRPGRFSFAPGMSKSDERFARGETVACVSGLLHATNCLWVNHPQAQTVASLKLLQLQVAQRCGLEVPRTLVTTEPDSARRFATSAGKIVYKRLSMAMLFEPEGDAAFSGTHLISAEDEEELDRVALAPALFQEYVEKAFEVRLTVVDGRVFTARINSQESERGRIDFRMALNDPDLTYEHHELPAVIHDGIIAMMRTFGLHFAAIDMIVTPDGRYVFLEANTGGQWIWLEQILGLPVSDALIDTLLKGNA